MSTIQPPQFEIGILARKLAIGIAAPVIVEVFRGWPPVVDMKTLGPLIAVGLLAALGIDVDTFGQAKARAKKGDR